MVTLPTVHPTEGKEAENVLYPSAPPDAASERWDAGGAGGRGLRAVRGLTQARSKLTFLESEDTCNLGVWRRDRKLARIKGGVRQCRRKT